MRHYKKGRKLGTDASHTKAMKKSLVAALFTNDRIKTTEARAKEIRPEVDRVITWAKRGDVHARRLAIAALGDKELVREIFEKVSQGMFADRPGGYTRIVKLGPRKGDKAPMVIMELVQESVESQRKAEEKAAAKKSTSAAKRTRKPAAAKTAEVADASEAADKADEAVENLDASEAAEAVEDAEEEVRTAEAIAEVADDKAAAEEGVAEAKAAEEVAELDASEAAEAAHDAAEDVRTDEAIDKAAEDKKD